MAIRYAINGFGRIGRNIVRAARGDSRIELVAVNDLTDSKTLAHLLKYDSVHDKFPGTVEARESAIAIDGKEIKVLAERDPAKLPWSQLGVDVVLECTGLFTKREKAALHLAGGAKKVLISAPSPDADVTLVYGVNHKTYDKSKHDVISNGSCTTNCLAPVAKVILENFGIVKGMMTTVHSYTNDQNILDLPHKDLRRARAAALSMIPTSTGAAKALSLVIPDTVKDVNQALASAANGALKGVLGVTDEPLVSTDFNGSPFSSIADLSSTMAVGDKMIKILSWYDNEMGFSNRMVDVLDHIMA
jgi:glyceraldehyde 3-phosphate dehydrogenase